MSNIYKLSDAARIINEPHPPTPTLPRLRERVRTGHEKSWTFSCRHNKESL